MTTARTYNLALEAVNVRTPRAKCAQVAIEVVSRSGTGADPQLRPGNPALVETYLAEMAYARAPNARAYQIALETISRSGLGADPRTGSAAVIDKLVAEVASSSKAKARSAQLALEVARRSGLGVDPLRGNPAVLQQLVAEVARYSWPVDAHGNPVGGPDSPGAGLPGAPDMGDTCHCVITPGPVPVKYLMRRPRRFP